MDRIGEKCFMLNKCSPGIVFNLEYPISTIKITRIYLKTTKGCVIEEPGKFKGGFSVQIRATKEEGKGDVNEVVSLFNPMNSSSSFTVIPLDRTFPAENIGVSKKQKLPFCKLEFTLSNPDTIQDELEIYFEFDSRPGGYENLSNYQIEQKNFRDFVKEAG